MATPVLQVAGLRKSYDGTIAVAGLDFAVDPGDIVGMVGPNGAGKTTTIRAVCGILPPSDGRITVAGHDLADAPVAAKRALAYVPDDPNLFDALTIWEHLVFIADAYRVQDFQPAAERLLEQFELTEKRDALAQDLSRGMRQKVAICCAYLHEPRLILLDEPMTGLDPRGIRTMKDSIRQRAEQGASVVVSSHLLALVEGMCNKLLIMHRGKGLYFGPLAEVRAALAAEDTDATLEEIFLRATSDTPSRPPHPPAAADPHTLDPPEPDPNSPQADPPESQDPERP